jgi:membrane protein
MRQGGFLSILKDTAKEWSEDKASRHAAALSYYTIFSIAPMLIIAIAVAGLVFGQEAARKGIMDEIGGMIGQGGAEAIQAMMEGASKPKEGIIATVLGVVALLFGASGVFGQLQDSMNTMWEVRPKPGKGVLGFLKSRFTSFSMVLVIAFLLLVSLVLSAGLSAMGKYLGGFLGEAGVLLRVVDLVVSLGVVTLLFGLMFKYLPDAEVRWKDVWTGALVTAVLFGAGRFLIGLYLGRSAVGSAYGAAGSLVIILLWIYYSSQILFFGAEFTQVYASRKGAKVRPDADAEAMEKPHPLAGRPAREPSAGTVSASPRKPAKPEKEAAPAPVPGRGEARPSGNPREEPEAVPARREAPAPAGAGRRQAAVAVARGLGNRGIGSAALVLSLAYVSGNAALRQLGRLLRHPRRA